MSIKNHLKLNNRQALYIAEAALDYLAGLQLCQDEEGDKALIVRELRSAQFVLRRLREQPALKPSKT